MASTMKDAEVDRSIGCLFVLVGVAMMFTTLALALLDARLIKIEKRLNSIASVTSQE